MNKLKCILHQNRHILVKIEQVKITNLIRNLTTMPLVFP